MYNFTNDWFNYHKYIWDSLINDLNPSKVLEIGSFEGASACYLIDKISKKENSELICVDLWPWEEVEKRFDENINKCLMKSFDKISFQKKKGHSHKIMAELLVNNKENYFDLVYVDGSHTADDVIFDACFSSKLCRPGGIIIFDDYLWPVVKKLPLEKKPKMAIDAFTNIFHDKITIIQKSLYQLYVVKNLEEKTHKKTH